jgi:hypothetical protein
VLAVDAGLAYILDRLLLLLAGEGSLNISV